MHKLDRTQLSTPQCLGAYDYRTQSWDNLRSDCKQNVREKLEALQGKTALGEDGDCSAPKFVRCAYCETEIYDGGHIEHFRRKNRRRQDAYPELTFSWENLFLSCNAKEHCGHFKDRLSAPPYSPDHLIKPDDVDPEEFLFFHSSGEVRPRSGLQPEDNYRAEETIRVFGLNDGPLRGARAKSINKYRKLNAEELEEIESCPDEDRDEYFMQEIIATRWDSYATIVKHFFLSKT